MRYYAGYKCNWRKVWRPLHLFAEVELARRFGPRSVSQWRLEANMGFTPWRHWQVLAQTWEGRNNYAYPAALHSRHVELSLLRDIDVQGSLLAGLKLGQTMTGINVRQSRAVSVSLWRRL